MPTLPRRLLVAGLLAVLAAPIALADGPSDNVADNVRPIPPKGVAVPDADLNQLKVGLAEFKKSIDALPAALKGRPELLDLLPDVEVYPLAT